MTRVAGEVADGMLVHAFTTEQYLRTVTLPLLEEGLTTRGLDRSEFQVVYPALVATGTTDQKLEAATAATRKQIAFYASTPAYRSTLEAHGWGDLQPDLHALSKQDRWDEMSNLIDDRILACFAVVGAPEQVGQVLHSRFAGAVDRIRLYQPYQAEPEATSRAVVALRHALVTANNQPVPVR